MRQWFVLYTKLRQEKVANHHLEQKGCETFLPMLYQPWKKRGRVIEPLFPNYLFVHIHYPEEYPFVLWTPGSKRLVSFGEDPTPIDEGIVEFLKAKTGSSGVIEIQRPLEVGDRITICAGPFEGLSAIIQNPPDRKGRVRVLMNILSQTAPVSLPANWIQGTRPPKLVEAAAQSEHRRDGSVGAA